MKFLEQQVLYVDNICSKFQGKKNKKIHNPSTCVVLRHNGESISLVPTLIASQGLEFFLFTMNFCHKMVSMLIICDKFQGKKYHLNNLLEIHQHV